MTKEATLPDTADARREARLQATLRKAYLTLREALLEEPNPGSPRNRAIVNAIQSTSYAIHRTPKLQSSGKLTPVESDEPTDPVVK